MKNPILCITLLATTFVVAGVPQELPPTAKALEGSYVDILQQDVPFGTWSAERMPYRAWMDTRPTSIVWECFGMNFNSKTNEWASVLDVFRALGMKSARTELGMQSMLYEDPSKLNPAAYDLFKRRLLALQAHGIRPMILLNSHGFGPGPHKMTRLRLLEDVKEGDLTVRVENVADVVPYHTGFCGQFFRREAFPLITNVAANGVCHLSAPMKKPIGKGWVMTKTLLYVPFMWGPIFKDGTPVPGARDTYRGWELFVKAVCAAAQEYLGTKGQPDSGFDLEVWNEYSFGSDFLRGYMFYYEPRLEFQDPFIMEKDGIVISGQEMILPITTEVVNNPANGFPGVRVISGLANQRPWDSGAGMWPGQYTFSRHFYWGISMNRPRGLELHLGLQPRKRLQLRLRRTGERQLQHGFANHIQQLEVCAAHLHNPGAH